MTLPDYEKPARFADESLAAQKRDSMDLRWLARKPSSPDAALSATLGF